MPSVLRDYLQFQPPNEFGGGDEEDQLGELLKQMQGMQTLPPPMMSQPRRAPLPQRPQQSLWDLLPQILAGAGDTVNAGAGIRSDSLGRVMGLQRGQRDQAYGDQVNQQNVAYQNRLADRQDEALRYQMQNQAQQQNFGRDSKLAELLMMHKALSDQQEKKTSMRSIFEQGLPSKFAEAGTPADLEKAYLDSLKDTQGDPKMMEAAKKAYEKRKDEVLRSRGAAGVLFGPKGFFSGPDDTQGKQPGNQPWMGGDPYSQYPQMQPEQPRAFWTNPWYAWANRSR